MNQNDEATTEGPYALEDAHGVGASAVDADVIRSMLERLEDLAMQNDMPIADGCGYFGTGLPLRVLHEWIINERDRYGIAPPSQVVF